MLGVFLWYEPGNARKPYQSRIRNRIDEPISQFWIDPFVLISPNDQRRRVNLGVLVLVQISSMNRARQREQMIRSVFPDKRRQVARDQLHWHVLGIRYTPVQDALQ